MNESQQPPNPSGKIALIGSGEMTASMVEVHKHLLGTADRRKIAYFLDTPAGFQPNADDISSKAQQYFEQHIQCRLEIASFKEAKKATDFDTQLVVKNLEQTDYLLLGPGSPTYLLRQLRDSPLLKALQKVVESGGSLAMASAAALTAGIKTLPVYEIYKVGEELHWQDGLNLLGSLGLDMVVIPHWNNAEGGTHDTRFCYMGEQRFLRLQALLPPETLFLGIDEHTACILDFAEDRGSIQGQGTVTLVQGDRRKTFSKGETLPLDLIRQGLTMEPMDNMGEKSYLVTPQAESEDSFWQQVHAYEQRFYQATNDHDYRTATSLLLDFDDRLNGGDARFESVENLSQARELYRELMVSLSLELQKLQGTVANHLEPLIGDLLSLRKSCKDKQQWAQADQIRAVLCNCGIHVTDTREGTGWHFITGDNRQ